MKSYQKFNLMKWLARKRVQNPKRTLPGKLKQSNREKRKIQHVKDHKYTPFDLPLFKLYPLLSFLVTNKSGERSTCTVSLYPSSIKDMVAYICAACKTNYVNMQEKYDNMQYNYVDMVIKLLIEYYNMYMNNMSKFWHNSSCM